MKNGPFYSPQPVVGDMILYKSELSNMPNKLFRVTAVYTRVYGAISVVGMLIKKYEADGWIDVTDSKIQQIYYWNGIILNENNHMALLKCCEQTFNLLQALTLTQPVS